MRCTIMNKMKTEIPYEFFFENDGTGLSDESRISEVIALLENEGDVVVLPDGTECRTEAELRRALEEKGGRR